MSSNHLPRSSAPAAYLAPGLWLEDLISIRDLSAGDVRTILDLADVMKARPKDFRSALAGKQLALFFEKPSLRTRLTFESGITSLGGTSYFVDQTRDRLDAREKLSDIAHNLERWVDGIVLRTFEHSTIQQMAEHAGIPVINALSSLEHPCQALADFMTLRQKFGDLSDVHLAFVGDGNNVAHSLMLTAALLGSVFSIATPPGYEPAADLVATAQAIAAGTGASIKIGHDPIAAVSGADAVYTDVWASMGQEAEAERRRTVFAGYQVNHELMTYAASHALFMHCLPAHRGDEVTDSVIDSSRSVVFEQAENRLHVQKAILFLLLSDSRHNLAAGRANA